MGVLSRRVTPFLLYTLLYCLKSYHVNVLIFKLLLKYNTHVDTFKFIPVQLNELAESEHTQVTTTQAPK